MYRKYFEKDSALVRRFTKLDIQQPSAEDTVKIIDANLPAHEVVNQVLSKLPDKPISNIDLSVLGC